MIDIIAEHTPNLKNIRQIGNLTETDKIYIEASAYERIHMDEFPEKRVFVLMGHTECKDCSYSTFIEGVIAVREISFERNVPQWNNRAWNDVFQEIKRFYENAVIVGWAVDIKGVSPAVTEELESIHREQFGGIHQLLLLMNSLEQEEYFYQNRNNRLRQKDGFYIYFDSAAERQNQDMDEAALDNGRRKSSVSVEFPQREQMSADSSAASDTKQPRARYRDLMKGEAQPAKDSGKNLSTYAVAAAALLLLAIIGTGIYQNRINMPDFSRILATFSSKSDALNQEETETVSEPMRDTQTLQDDVTVPVEEVPAGELIGDGTDAGVAEDIMQTTGDAQLQTGAPQTNSDAQTEETVQTDTTATTVYIVQKGDTLLEICRSVYGSASRLAEIERLNNLENPNAIYEGQQLILPE